MVEVVDSELRRGQFSKLGTAKRRRKVMSKKLAGLLMLTVCVVSAILLLANSIRPVWSGVLFALSLLLLGGLSRGFRKEN
jgi:hypothetical protein